METTHSNIIQSIIIFLDQTVPLLYKIDLQQCLTMEISLAEMDVNLSENMIALSVTNFVVIYLRRDLHPFPLMRSPLLNIVVNLFYIMSTRFNAMVNADYTLASAYKGDPRLSSQIPRYCLLDQ